MDVDDATGTAVKLLRRRPTELLPPFVAEAATGVVAQTVALATVAVALFSLQGTGRVERVTEAVAAATETGPPTDREVEAVLDALQGLLTPTVAAVLLLGGVVGLVSVAVFRAAVGAAKTHAALVAVRQERGRPSRATAATGERTDGGASEPLTAAVEGAFADTRSFVGLALLRLAVLVGPLVLVAAGGVVALLGVLLVLPALLFAYVGFLFAPEAVVVEGVGAVGGLRRSLSVVRRRTGRAAGYVALEVGAYLGVAVAGGLLGLVGVGRVTSVLTLFVVFPWLGLVRMGLYLPDGPGPASPAETGRATAPGVDPTAGPDRTAGSDVGAPRRGRAGPAAGEDDHGHDRDRDDGGATVVREPGPSGPEAVGAGSRTGPRAAVEDLLWGIRTGVGELRRFVAAHSGLVAVALGTFGLGAVVGRALGPRATEPVVGDPGAVFGAFPVGTAVNIAANNWLVAIAESYAGLALGVPTLGNLLFNGLVVGGLSGLFDPAVFAALVLPHAVVEVPALAVGGAVGLHLAREGLGVARGRRSAATFAGELRRALLVLVGLVPVFLLAGFVEAFVTPAVGGLVGG